MTELLILGAVLASFGSAIAAWVLRGRREAAKTAAAVNAFRVKVEDAVRPRTETARKLEEIRTEAAKPAPTTLKQLEAELAKPDEW